VPDTIDIIVSTIVPDTGFFH